MPTGILKYKQDDGSIVELNPAGFVPQTTYDAGQAAQDAKITAAQTTANKANANIGNWETENPEETISDFAAANRTEIIRQAGVIARLETDKADKSAIPDVSALVTKETYTAGQAAQDAKIAALKAVEPDILPYLFNRITLSGFMQASEDAIYATVSINLPWLHSQDHQLTARLDDSTVFYIVNLRTGSVETVTDGIILSTACSSSKPYHVNIIVQIPAAYDAHIPYLICSPTTYITIE